MQKFNKITQLFLEILIIYYLGKSYNTQLKLHDNAVVSMDLQLHAKNKQNNSTLFGDLGSLLFGQTGARLITPNKYYMI